MTRLTLCTPRAADVHAGGGGRGVGGRGVRRAPGGAVTLTVPLRAAAAAIALYAAEAVFFSFQKGGDRWRIEYVSSTVRYGIVRDSQFKYSFYGHL